MYYKYEDEQFVYAECEMCGNELKLRKYALLVRESDMYKASRSISCYNCKKESNKVIDIEAKLKEQREFKLRQQEEKMQAELRPFRKFREETELEFLKLKDLEDTRQIMNNFINTLHANLGTRDSILAFEQILRTQAPIGYLLLHDIDVQVSFISNEIRQDYSDRFLRLVPIIKRKYGLKSDEESIYVSWLLLQNGLIHHEASIFIKEYGSDYEGIEKSLESYIDLFINNPLTNVNSIQSIISFTYFLINENLLSSRDIVKEYTFVNDQIKVYLDGKQMDDFERQLMGIVDMPEKPLRTISDVDLMTGHEFEYFIKELFIKMGYSAIVTKGRVREIRALM